MYSNNYINVQIQSAGKCNLQISHDALKKFYQMLVAKLVLGLKGSDNIFPWYGVVY